MTEKLTRRDFLKLAGATAATAALTGCGPMSRYIRREPYTAMPEYTFNGQSTHFATTCRECPAGCGLIVRTFQGRAIKVEGNPRHPVNLGKTCARGQATLHGLYNPDRVQQPLRQARRPALSEELMTWDSAVQVVADSLRASRPDEIAFLLGLAPDHLFDLVSTLTSALGAPAPLRFGALGLFEARATLARAAQTVFGRADPLFFDLAGADVTFSFGANFLETWLSPVAYTRGFARMRRGRQGRRGYLVQFEPRMSQTAAVADEWIPIVPGTEGLVAQAIGRLAAEARGGALPPAFADVDVAAAAEASGVSEETLLRLARLFAQADRALAIPGGSALGHAGGWHAAQAILLLNALAGNLAQTGGVYFAPAAPLAAGGESASLKDIQTLISRMAAGRIRVLFIHGVNPLFELPASLGFAQALAKVPTVISFATFPDETALAADYIFPDHHGLESWGYQRVLTGSDLPALSGAQPVVVPFYDTRATADVLLAAVQAIGGELAKALPFRDEVAFIQDRLANLIGVSGGSFDAPEVNSFLASFQQFGGWWGIEPALTAPDASAALGRALRVDGAQPVGEGDFYLLPFVSPVLGEAGANKPWLQEIPDPVTTVMWNTWVEINPHTADQLGLHDDDIVQIVSEAGVIEAAVYRYPAIRPDVIAVPFGQGHTAYGRYAAGRGSNPLGLISARTTPTGDLAFAAHKVRIRKTGRKHELARGEGRLGVYGFEKH